MIFKRGKTENYLPSKEYYRLLLLKSSKLFDLVGATVRPFLLGVGC